MADILLRGFEMPTDASLWLLIRPDGTVHKLKVGGKHGEPQQGVAVPLPAGHGRLIDADALDYTMLYKENWMRGTGVEAPAIWKSDIDAADTIVPAEGGTDNG